MSPLPLPAALPADISVVFTDIDDTLTWEGRLPTDTFLALQRLADAGITVVPVTGGCGGWADCIIRTWPVSTIIAENGSFWLHQNDQSHVERHFLLPEDTRHTNMQQLHEWGAAFRAAFPMIPYTQDQDFRLTDIAFDIGQQNSVEKSVAEAAAAWWQDKAVTARLSSIHLNVWMGSYTKASAALRWLARQDGLSMEQCIFIGDSPNDESMFAEFPISVGVSNIARFLSVLAHQPTYITSQPGGHGFCALTESILQGRAI